MGACWTEEFDIVAVAAATSLVKEGRRGKEASAEGRDAYQQTSCVPRNPLMERRNNNDGVFQRWLYSDRSAQGGMKCLAARLKA